MILRSIAVGAALVCATAAPAVASTSADTWHWGSIYSADRAGKAIGTVVGHQVNGRLYDLPHRKGCTWLKFRWNKISGGKGYQTYHTCDDTKPLKFSFSPGPMHSIEGKVCRGTSKKTTGRCSIYEGVWAEGG